MTHELPSEDVLLQLERKMRKDTTLLNVAIDDLNNMGDIIQSIFEQELQINYTLGIIKENQDAFTSFLVKLNQNKQLENKNKNGDNVDEIDDLNGLD